MIITEGPQPSEDGQGYLLTPGIHTDEQTAGWRRVTDAVHDVDEQIVVQLMHVGRIAHSSNTPHGRQPVAPSAVKPAAAMFTASGMQEMPEPRALKTDEVAAIVEDFRRAAAAAIAAGADGVEIHGANGYVAAKAGIVGFKRSLALEVGGYGITVNVITLGLTVTQAVRDHFPPALLHAQRKGRYRDVAEVAALAFTGDELAYGTFELAAPGMVDRIEIAAVMGAAIGRTIRAGESAPPPVDPNADAMHQGPARMLAHYDEHGFPGGNGLVLRAILAREPRSLAQLFSELADS